jgi:hypothetical protein
LEMIPISGIRMHRPQNRMSVTFEWPFASAELMTPIRAVLAKPANMPMALDKMIIVRDLSTLFDHLSRMPNICKTFFTFYPFGNRDYCQLLGLLNEA